MTNFANWYAFYRTRILSMKAASGIAFSALDQNSRVGFHTLWENGTLFTNVKDFTAANKQTWLTNAYKVEPRTAARRCRTRCGASASSSPAISRARACRARRIRSIP